MNSQFLHLQDRHSHASSSRSTSNINLSLDRKSSLSTSPSASASSSKSSSASSSSSHLVSYTRYSMDNSQQGAASVEIMRCSRCAKTAEAISRRSSDGISRVSVSDASASGMVRFGHNLYYCERCARLVGYK